MLNIIRARRADWAEQQGHEFADPYENDYDRRKQNELEDDYNAVGLPERIVPTLTTSEITTSTTSNSTLFPNSSKSTHSRTIFPLVFSRSSTCYYLRIPFLSSSFILLYSVNG